MDVNEPKADAAAGMISFASLVDVIVVQQKRIEQLEAQIKSKNPTDRLDQADTEGSGKPNVSRLLQSTLRAATEEKVTDACFPTDPKLLR